MQFSKKGQKSKKAEIFENLGKNVQIWKYFEKGQVIVYCVGFYSKIEISKTFDKIESETENKEGMIEIFHHRLKNCSIMGEEAPCRQRISSNHRQVVLLCLIIKNLVQFEIIIYIWDCLQLVFL